MRILGIDPGSAITGWGVVEGDGQNLRHIANGCIRTASDAPMAERLGLIFQGLSRVIAEHAPHAASVEEVFVSKNVLSAIKLGQARGAAIAAASQFNLPVHEYTAVEVKKTVVGFGRAEKQQVQEMVRLLLALDKAAQEDASDALAGAICHLNHLNWHQRVNP